LYPAPDAANPKNPGTMEVYDLEAPTPIKLENMRYSMGDKVYDVAWNAYIEVLKSRNVNPLPEKPKVDSDLRLAFPPST
jgi:hypothetical protein